MSLSGRLFGLNIYYTIHFLTASGKRASLSSRLIGWSISYTIHFSVAGVRRVSFRKAIWLEYIPLMF